MLVLSIDYYVSISTKIVIGRGEREVGEGGEGGEGGREGGGGREGRKGERREGGGRDGMGGEGRGGMTVIHSDGTTIFIYDVTCYVIT